jgi:AraC family transcriptional regulator of adaptative response / DNA-3-methyladenine glycosylase II
VYALSPTEIRRSGTAKRRSTAVGGEGIEIQLAYRPPIELVELLTFLGLRAVPGVESWDGRTYSRVLSLPHGEGFVSISSAGSADKNKASARASASGYVSCRLELQDTRDFTTAVARVRSLLDLDADPVAVSSAFTADPLMKPLVDARPGLRIPGSVDGNEIALRAVLGQQVSVGGARTLAGRLSQAFGKAVEQPRDGLTHGFPSVDAIAAADPSMLPLPAARGKALVGLARSLSDRRVRIDPGADRDESEESLKSLPGIGQWTASYIRMRGLGDPDVFMAGDLGVRRAMGMQSDAGVGERWRPWRSYATVHLWAAPPAGQPSKKESAGK